MGALIVREALVYAEYPCGTAGYADLRATGRSIHFAGAPNEVKSLCQVTCGDGPNKPRQDSAHAHCSIVTPDGKFQMVVDLTLDKIVAYDFANRAQGLKVVPSATIDTGKVAPGAGPRHIVFHPNGKLAFVIFELNSLVASYRYTGEGFEFIQIENLLAKASRTFSKAAAIKLSAGWFTGVLLEPRARLDHGLQRRRGNGKDGVPEQCEAAWTVPARFRVLPRWQVLHGWPEGELAPRELRL